MQQREDSSRDLSRIAGTVAIVAGVAFVAGEVLHRAKPDIDFVACATADAYLVNLLDLLKYGLLGITLLLLVRMLGQRLSRAGRFVGRCAGTGFVVTGVANGFEHCAHLEALGLVYVSGLLVGLLGTVVFGVFLVRSRALATWVGWAITVGVLGFMAAAEQGGAFLVGAALMTVGVHLVTVHSARAPSDLPSG